MKKILILLLSFLLLFNPNVLAEGNDTNENNPNPPVENNPVYLRVDGDKTITVNPGDSGRIALKCYISSNSLPNLLFGQADQAGNPNVILNTPSDEMRLSHRYFNIRTGEYEGFLNFSFEIPKTAQAGTYPVTFQVSVDNITTVTYVAYIRVEADIRSSAKLNFNEVTVMPKNVNLKPGQPVAIAFELENNSDVPAYNVDVVLEGLGKESGFTLIRDLSAKNYPVIEPGQRKRLSFEMNSQPTSPGGVYEFTIKATYNGPNGITETKLSAEQKVFITLNNDRSQSSQISITNLNYPTKTVFPGNTVKLSFDITNNGTQDANRVIVKAPVEGNGLVSRSVSQVFFEKLSPGETKSLEFTYYATPSATTQNYAIPIKVEYYDGISSKEEPAVTEQVAGFFVSNPEKDNEGPDGEKKNSIPKLIVNKYEFEPKLPKAGEEFKMKLSFYNTHSKKTVKNIKIFLTSMEKSDNNSNSAGSNIFTPVDSSNTFYIDSIPPKSAVDKEITLYTVPDAQAKTYTVTANFEYEDDKNTEFKATEEIGIPVIQPSKLEIGEVNAQTSAMVGESVPINVTFFNTGKVTLYNMMVKFESEDFTAQNPILFIGNFQAGNTEMYEVSISANETGTKTGDIVFSYEDSSGKKQEVRHKITMDIEDMPAPDPNYDPSQDPGFEDPTASSWTSIFKKWYFWTPLVLIALAIAFIIRRYHHKKQEKDLTIDE